MSIVQPTQAASVKWGKLLLALELFVTVGLSFVKVVDQLGTSLADLAFRAASTTLVATWVLVNQTSKFFLIDQVAVA